MPKQENRANSRIAVILFSKSDPKPMMVVTTARMVGKLMLENALNTISSWVRAFSEAAMQADTMCKQ